VGRQAWSVDVKAGGGETKENRKEVSHSRLSGGGGGRERSGVGDFTFQDTTTLEGSLETRGDKQKDKGKETSRRTLDGDRSGTMIPFRP